MDDDAAGDDGNDDGDEEGWWCRIKFQICSSSIRFCKIFYSTQVSEDPVADCGSDLDQEVALDPGDGMENYDNTGSLLQLIKVFFCRKFRVRV